MKRIQVGSRVRIAAPAIMTAALGLLADRRPEPGQMVLAGRADRVTSYRRDSHDRSMYGLQDAPGLWPEEWIDPI